ncbi:MAG: phasin family protein [Bryobacterales bacterium]|nr:phasin family protein [Bryobacteraceae bacterium]MDW8131268.1 phasin family protein [Bryobacterales bacterium]
MTEETRADNEREVPQGEPSASPPGQAEDAVVRGARLLALAALGAVVAAGEGSARFFRALVEKGERAEPQAKERLEALSRTLGRAAGRFEKGARELRDRARGLARRGGRFLDEKVACALRRAGVPTRQEIQDLIARVDALGARLDALAERLQPEGRSGSGGLT